MTENMEMDQLVALCKRRGFLFQSSEIYGGLKGFWDYGPLGVELKRNVREAWWRDMVTAHNELDVAPGAPTTYEMTGLDCTIIMHPQAWKCSGHYDLFHDKMVDCRESNRRYRYDQVRGRWVEAKGKRIFVATVAEVALEQADVGIQLFPLTKWKSGGKYCGVELGSKGNPQSFFVEVGAAAAAGGKEFIPHWVIDHRMFGAPLDLVCNRDRKVWVTM